MEAVFYSVLLLTIILITALGTILYIDAVERKKDMAFVRETKLEITSALEKLSTYTKSQSETMKIFDERLHALEFHVQAKVSQVNPVRGFRE
jgi:hypothetical protein